MGEVIIEIKQGLLKGKTGTDFQGGTYYSFQGIPYAKPPLGKLRFRAPQPPDGWTGIRDATEEGNECFSRHVFYQHLIGSEDCLVLNVYTPELPFEKKLSTPKPVMVWIHGGAFLYGSSKTDLYNPDYLLPQDVVLVTINYRIGLLGFLNLDNSSLAVPGNAGLKDVVMALRWVQDNISFFMGDPNNVTVCGESAGGASAHYLMLSPMTKGLFHRVIAQSGCALSCWASGYNCIQEIATHLGLRSEDEEQILKKLQELPVEEIIAVQEKLDHNFYAHKRRPVAPVVEKSSSEPSFLSKSPLEVLLSGNYNKVPLLIGYASREGMLLEAIQPDKENLQVITNFENTVPHLYKCGRNASKVVAEKIKKFYYGDEEPSNKDMGKFHVIITDSFFLESINRTVKLHARTSDQPVFFYRFSLETKLNFFKNLANINLPGACHGDDLGYLFKTMVSPDIESGSIEELAIKRFTKLWTNFAKNGNPNCKETNGLIDIVWKPVTEKELNFLDIAEKLTVGTNPENERMSFWDEMQEICEQRCKL